ncbi:S8 family serine peptidase [Virgisporangium aurantiacum]|uniref:Peptidase S8/S53 domain-containing protein n=1 Tax=Virgisporangium aurantiacum TaxID=175570 RepID=A0A8J3ZJ34_9ACTN|nr:S8 family serine peptidase [Virgisporangium aurantiacum]GIJ62450.1 hypothetical protein Vau01_099660 [Virgisporangium aurantiacum]
MRLKVVLAAASVAALALPAAEAAADPAPPALPAPASGCVGASAVTVRDLPWATARMAPYLLSRLTDGQGVTVAVLDSGVSAGAAGLAGAVDGGVDVVSGGPATTDCLGRGTAFAAIIAGRPVPGSGVVGMAPGAGILPVRIIDPQGRVTAAALATGIREAARRGARVILVGTGLAEDNPDLRAAVADAVAHDALVVAPVNDRTRGEAGRPPAAWFPAADPQVLAVGGVAVDGKPTEVTGPAAGVDVLAPAQGAVVPGPSGIGHYGVGGTGVAAAFVAGAAALVRAAHPELSEAAVRTRLLDTAERPGTGGPGTVDPYAAATTVDVASGQRTVPDRPPVSLPEASAGDPAVTRAWLLCGTLGGATLLALVVLWLVRTRRSGAPPLA